jgi:hypothetical protein
MPKSDNTRKRPVVHRTLGTKILGLMIVLRGVCNYAKKHFPSAGEKPSNSKRHKTVIILITDTPEDKIGPVYKMLHPGAPFPTCATLSLPTPQSCLISIFSRKPNASYPASILTASLSFHARYPSTTARSARTGCMINPIRGTSTTGPVVTSVSLQQVAVVESDSRLLFS